MPVCRDCGSVNIQFDEPTDDGWWSTLVTMSDQVPSQEICEAWLDEKGISDEIAEDAAHDMHNKLRYNPKTQRWMPGGYLGIYDTWRSWCRNALRRNGQGSGMKAKAGGYY